MRDSASAASCGIRPRSSRLATSEVMNTVLPARDSPVAPMRTTGSKKVSDSVSVTLPTPLELVVQVQGKKRGEIMVPKDVDQDTALAAAKANEDIAKWLEGMQIVKVILVPGRLLNLVVKPA